MIDDIKTLWPIFAIGAVLVLVMVIALSVIIPDPSHTAFRQPAGSDLNYRGLAVFAVFLGLAAKKGKGIWDRHRMPSSRR